MPKNGLIREPGLTLAFDLARPDMPKNEIY